MEVEGRIISRYSKELTRLLALSTPSRQMLTIGLFANGVIDDVEKMDVMESASLLSANKLISYITSKVDGSYNTVIWKQLESVESLKDINIKIKAEIEREKCREEDQDCSTPSQIESMKGDKPLTYEGISREGGRVTNTHLPLLNNKLWDVRPEWEQFARQLPVNDTVIKGVKASNPPTNVVDQLSQVLDRWRMKGGVRTWRVIHTSLGKVRHKDIADNVLKRYPDLDTNVPFDEDSYISVMMDVLKDIAPIWSTFGQHLGLPNSDIKSIKGEEVLTNCFTQLLEEWISYKGDDANIINVIKACEAIGNRELAGQLISDTDMIREFPVLNKLK